MKRLHIIAFIVIVVVPVCALLWMGDRMTAGEAQLRRHQFDKLVVDRLSDIRDRARSAVDDLERELLAAMEIPVDGEEFRDLGRSQPYVRQAFVVSAEGKLEFPRAGDDASREELEFIERTRPIWNRSSVLRAPPGDASESSDRSSREAKVEAASGKTSYRPRGDDITALARTQRSGWLTWYWREGLHLLLWMRSEERVVGVEVERIALLSAIVARLPTSENTDSRIVLRSSRGEAVHQWGLYEPAKDEAAIGSLDLGFPLDTWSLNYYAAPEQRSAFLSAGNRGSTLIGVAAVAIALLTLAIFLFRDVRRRLREAAERVSFVTQVSHELKTPLTNIRLYAELLDHELSGEDGVVADSGRDRLAVVVAESQRLTRLINNILTFSKHKREQLTVAPSWIDLDDVVGAVVEQFGPALRQREIEPVLALGVDEETFADPDAVGQIIANLLSNVLKYATDGETVELSTTLESDWVCVAVTDEGPGISTRDARDVFKPFVRLSDSLSEGVSGTGIGLSIARELALLHDGDLRLATSGGGARFELRLPRKTRSEA